MPKFIALTRLLILLLAFALASCTLQTTQQAVFRATVPATQNSAPIYTPTPTQTHTPVVTPSDTRTATPTDTATPEPTPGIQTLTPPSPDGAPPPAPIVSAPESSNAGWSCDDFPCEDDIDGFTQRIKVQPGFALSHVGRFPGAPIQIAYGRDGTLYGTVLENGTQYGAVYRMNPDGSTERYSGDLVSPYGLAFQPGTDWLYVSARVTLEQDGGVWRIPPGGGEPEAVVTDLPCCLEMIENQPNGLTFGPDGYLYLGIGGLTDQAEPPPGRQSNYVTVGEREAAILRIHPHTGEVERYAAGIRNPQDIAFTSNRQMYATDVGLFVGPGDRLLRVDAGAHYGWPFYRERGCDNCPPTPPNVQVAPDLLPLRNRMIPRGLAAYTATQFPANMYDSLFVALWNGIEGGQRIVRVDPARISSSPSIAAQQPLEAFVTGLIRPTDVTIAPDGSLVIADYVYGHVWRVSYEG